MQYGELAMIMQPLDKREGVIWYNGALQPWQSAKIHVLTHGLHYATSVFEGIRIYNGQAFRLQQHLERFLHSAKQIYLNIPYTIKELYEATLQVVASNNLNSGYIRPVAFKGAEEAILAGQNCSVNVAIAAWSAFESSRQQLNMRGINAEISTWRKFPANVAPADTKTAGIYMMAHTVKQQAQANGFDDAIMLDMADNLTEATTSNLFLIKGKQLHTPIPDCFLNGITRQEIIKIARQLGMQVEERHIHVDELASFDAAFLTGTAIEMSPIASIVHNQHKHVFELNNPIYNILLSGYQQVTGS